MSKAKRPALPDLMVDTAYLLSQQTSVQTFKDRLIYFPKGDTESWLRGWIEVTNIRAISNGRAGVITARKVLGGTDKKFIVTSPDVDTPWELAPDSLPFRIAAPNWKELYQTECLRNILSLEKKIEEQHQLADLVKNSRVY